jgi:hypothetical protein
VAHGLSSLSQDSDTWRMNPWLRMLAAFGVAIAAALFLKVLPPLIVLVFFIGGIRRSTPSTWERPTASAATRVCP